MTADRLNIFVAVCLAFLTAQGQGQEASGTLISSQSIVRNVSNGKIYAVDEHGGAITVIDPATNSTARVRVGSGPEAVAVNSVTGRAYVANSSDGTVSVLDGGKNIVIATVKAGPHPYVLAVNEKTDKVYVTNTFSDAVGVIDGATDAVKLMKLGSADNIVADSGRSRIFLLGYEDPAVRILDGETDSVEKINIGKHLWGMAVNSAMGDAYFTRIQDGELVALDAASHRMTAVAVGSLPCAVAVDAKTNTVYVANYGDDTVTVIDGGRLQAIATVRVGRHPQAIAIDPQTDMVYVANTHADTVTVIDGSTHHLISTLPAGTNPFGITASSITGRVYVARLGEPSFAALVLAQR